MSRLMEIWSLLETARTPGLMEVERMINQEVGGEERREEAIIKVRIGIAPGFSGLNKGSNCRGFENVMRLYCW